jgi:hypothetical protein
MFRRQRLAVHLITQQIVTAERIGNGHAARELLRHLKVESTFAIRFNGSRLSAPDGLTCSGKPTLITGLGRIDN